jgi:hypothetical protein
MATENCLWGAPRIHGELLKLGFTVSERTVSRYLPDRLTRRSQTWRTFLANHIGSLALSSTVTSSFATSDDGVDACDLPCRPCSVVTRRAVRFHSVGSGRLASSAPIDVSWLVGRTGSASPPHTQTFPLWQGPPKGQSNPHRRRRLEGLTSRDFILPEGANQRSETQTLGLLCTQSGEPSSPAR